MRFNALGMQVISNTTRQVSRAEPTTVRETMHAYNYLITWMHSQASSKLSKSHQLSNIIPELERAYEDLEFDLEQGEQDLSAVDRTLKSIIGDLSGLRCSKFN